MQEVEGRRKKVEKTTQFELLRTMKDCAQMF